MRSRSIILLSLVFIFLLPLCQNPAQAYPVIPDTYDRSGDVPDFGQHSQNWCWVAAAANSAYWFKHKKGLTNLYPDSWDSIYEPSKTPPTPDKPNPWYDDANGYSQLMKEIAEAAGRVFSQTVTAAAYEAAKKKIFKNMKVKVVGNEYPGIPSLNYLMQELSHEEDVELWVSRGTAVDHVITATSYHKEGTDPTKWYIDFKDSWDYVNNRPDHSNSTSSGSTFFGYMEAGYDPSQPLKFKHSISGQILTAEYIFSESVPEPGTILLLVVGLGTLVRARRWYASP